MNRYKMVPLAAAICTATVTAITAPVTMADEFTLEEIIVTATKRATNLQDTPVTVNAFDSNTIQDAGINNAGDLANSTPSLSVSANTSPFTARLTIRGIGTAQTDPALEPSVGMFVDGVYIGRSGLGMSDMTDIERIEVLQGPQGTLYGKNTNAGAISITTKTPNMEEYEGYVETSFGNYDMKKITVAASGPITNTLGFRLSGNVNQQDGYLENATGNDDNGADDWNMIGKLLWQPTDELSIQLNLSHIERDTDCCGSDPLHSTTVQNELASQGLTVLKNDNKDYKISNNVDTAFELEADAAALIVDYDLDMGSIKSITSWDDYEYTSTYDADQSQLDILTVTNEYNAGDSFSQEFRFSSATDGDIDYQAGIFYYEQTTQRGDGNSIVEIGDDFNTVGSQVLGLPSALLGLMAQPGDNASSKHVWETQTLAVFGQATWHATDRLHITAGLRWTDEEKEADLFSETSSTAPGYLPANFFGPGTPPVDLTTIPANLLGPGVPSSDVALSRIIDGIFTPVDAKLNRRSINKDWLLNVSYDLNEDTMVFASASTGSKSGGFNGVNGAVDDREFDDEKTRSYELGIKTTLLDSRLRVNASAFLTEVDNYQQLLQLDTGAGTTVRNEGALEVNGIDLNIDALPLPNLTLSAGLLYLNKYEVTEGDAKGDELIHSAELSGNLAATYTLPVADGTAYARFDYSFKGDHLTVVASDYEQDIENINLKMGWRNDNWNISVWGKNLKDEAYAGVATNPIVFTGSSAYFLAPPRTYGVTARYDF
ncbi:TonB-dependent receptor [Maricurvus nonylphenolicus]|uniref:TonB-dependent receptor n=1 Tax=Maricurvus nonylphenolicus TaxID=1008307 RepID=UPI0036F22711